MSAPSDPTAALEKQITATIGELNTVSKAYTEKAIREAQIYQLTRDAFNVKLRGLYEQLRQVNPASLQLTSDEVELLVEGKARAEKVETEMHRPGRTGDSLWVVVEANTITEEHIRVLEKEERIGHDARLTFKKDNIPKLPANPHVDHGV